MAMHTRAWCAWLWAASAALSATTAVLTAMAWSELEPVDRVLAPINPVASLLYASLGVLVVLRAANRIGCPAAATDSWMRWLRSLCARPSR